MIQLISVPTDLFQVHRSLLWVAGEQDRNVCVVKGKSEESCQNYVKENVPPPSLLPTPSSKYYFTPNWKVCRGKVFPFTSAMMYLP